MWNTIKLTGCVEIFSIKWKYFFVLSIYSSWADVFESLSLFAWEKTSFICICNDEHRLHLFQLFLHTATVFVRLCCIADVTCWHDDMILILQYPHIFVTKLIFSKLLIQRLKTLHWVKIWSHTSSAPPQSPCENEHLFCSLQKCSALSWKGLLIKRARIDVM